MHVLDLFSAEPQRQTMLQLGEGRTLYPAGFCTLQEVGLAMIKAASQGYPAQILEVTDIVELARS
jgi:hypothetical protein